MKLKDEVCKKNTLTRFIGITRVPLRGIAVYNLTTLFNTELKHVQLHQHTKRVGVVDKPQACRTENARFIALVSLFEQFEARTNQFFTGIYRLVVLTVLTDT